MGIVPYELRMVNFGNLRKLTNCGNERYARTGVSLGLFPGLRIILLLLPFVIRPTILSRALDACY